MNHNIYEYITGVLWKDENFDVASYRATGVAPPDVVTIPGTTIATVAFNGTTTAEDISACKELNHDYQEGGDIYFHVHWYPTSTAIGDVKWNIDYYITKWNKGTVASGTMSAIGTTTGVSWMPIITSFGPLELGELAEIGSQIHFRFYRNPNDVQDTYGANAAVATIGYHYPTNSRGSSKISSK